MNAVQQQTQPLSVVQSTLAVPRELTSSLAENERARVSFAGLSESDRRGFVAYVVDAAIPEVRERRAALVVMSLIGMQS